MKKLVINYQMNINFLKRFVKLLMIRYFQNLKNNKTKVKVYWLETKKTKSISVNPIILKINQTI